MGMSFRHRLARGLLGPEMARIEETLGLMSRAYIEGPFVLPPEELMAQLREVDSSILVDLVMQMGYDVIGQFGGSYSGPTEAERLRTVDENRRLFRYDVVTQWIIWLWTNFGFGSSVNVTIDDDKAQQVWSEFWGADRNRAVLAADELHALSEDLLTDGEKFFAFFVSTVDGEATIRDVDTKEIVDLVTHPDDSSTILFYKRSFSYGSSAQPVELYYPDWLAKITGVLDSDYVDLADGVTKKVSSVLPKGAKRADEVNEKTDVVLLHVPHNKKGGVRGWPLMTAGASWSRTHKSYRQDRASVARTTAMYVNKLKVKGGSRAVDSMRAQLQSGLTGSNYSETNPPATAGSTFLENDAADLQRLSQGTGAGDAKSDGEALLLMAGLGGGVYPHWMGAGDAYRLATASSMEGPMYREFFRYQAFWRAQFEKIVRIVLWGSETYGSASFPEDYTVSVSTDKLLQTDLTQFASGLKTIWDALFLPAVQAKAISDETAQKLLMIAWTQALQAMGVDNVGDIVTDKAFKKPEPEKPPAASAAPGMDEQQPANQEQPAPAPEAGQEEKPSKQQMQEALLILQEARDLLREAQDG